MRRPAQAYLCSYLHFPLYLHFIATLYCFMQVSGFCAFPVLSHSSITSIAVFGVSASGLPFPNATFSILFAAFRHSVLGRLASCLTLLCGDLFSEYSFAILYFSVSHS